MLSFFKVKSKLIHRFLFITTVNILMILVSLFTKLLYIIKFLLEATATELSSYLVPFSFIRKEILEELSSVFAFNKM